MAGLASAGVDVVRLGVVPTPGVAFLTGQQQADLGVMLSASHNPMPDNGIKFFARGGVKLDDAVEDAIEARLGEPWARPTGAGVGRVRDDALAGRDLRRAPGEQRRHARSACTASRSSSTAPTARPSSPARPPSRPRAPRSIRIHATPDGLNINENCGSTHMDSLRSAVLEHGADLGIALDGDADRCLAVDADGRIVDGDQILAVLALAHARGRPAQERHRRGHGDEQPRLPARDAPRRHRGRADRGRRPLRARGDEGRAATRSAASSPGT